MSDLLKLRPFQDAVVDAYIECGGRGHYTEYSRGQGLTTVLLYLAIQQTAATRRRVVFVTDLPIHFYTFEIPRIAWEFFGIKVVRKDGINFLINGNLLRLVRITNGERDFIGRKVDDVYGEVSDSNFRKWKEGMLYLQHYTMRPTGEDGTGMFFIGYRQ